MRQIGHREMSGELAEAKKSVVNKTVPEVINHIRSVLPWILSVLPWISVYGNNIMVIIVLSVLSVL